MLKLKNYLNLNHELFWVLHGNNDKPMLPRLFIFIKFLWSPNSVFLTTTGRFASFQMSKDEFLIKGSFLIETTINLASCMGLLINRIRQKCSYSWLSATLIPIFCPYYPLDYTFQDHHQKLCRRIWNVKAILLKQLKNFCFPLDSR